MELEVETNAEAPNVQQGKSGHKFGTQDVLVPWHVRLPQSAEAGPGSKLYAPGGSPAASSSEDSMCHTGAAESFERANHGVLDASKGALVFQRYCHVYCQGELENIVASLGDWLKVTRVYWDTGNWAVCVKKLAEMPSRVT